MVTRLHWLSAAALACLTGCLAAPQVKECIDFDVEEVADNPACDNDCTTYCEALVRICPDPSQADGTDAVAACRVGCDEFGVGEVLEGELNCRFGVLREARTDPSACEGAGIGGGSRCASGPCDEYCRLTSRDCQTMYSSEQQCMDICETFPQNGTSLGGDSVQCRVAQLKNERVLDPCNAASIASDGSCGSTCEGYCAQVMNNCVGDNAIYPDLESCLAVCSLLPQGTYDDWGGVGTNSLMCRAYHASSPALFAPGTHCPHAGVYNDAQCGSTCETYCDPLVCGGEFADVNACVDECVRLVTDGEPMFPDPTAARQCDQ